MTTRFYLSIGLAHLFFFGPGFSQRRIYSISDQQLCIVQTCLNKIYNNEFDSAEIIIHALQKELPDYYGTYLLQSYFYNHKYGPLHDGNEVFNKFLQVADSTIKKSERILDHTPDSYEAKFFILSIHAMLARSYVDSGNNWKAIMETQKAYHLLTRLKDHVNKFPDLNLYCGIYNYYREKYPEDNPVIKPFLLFFRKGDKNLGLSMLKKGSEEGLFTQLECLTYLYHIYLRYEFQPHKSIEYARKLYDLYPGNNSFIALLAENLIFINKYSESKPLIDCIVQSENPYYRYIGTVYLGLYNEQFQFDHINSEKLYSEALLIGERENIATPHYQGICYLGLGRIFLHKGDETEAKHYLKMAEKTSEYGFIRDEAKALLNNL